MFKTFSGLSRKKEKKITEEQSVVPLKPDGKKSVCGRQIWVLTLTAEKL